MICKENLAQSRKDAKENGDHILPGSHLSLSGFASLREIDFLIQNFIYVDRYKPIFRYKCS